MRYGNTMEPPFKQRKKNEMEPQLKKNENGMEPPFKKERKMEWNRHLKKKEK